MHADEATITEELVRGLLRERFPAWAELPIDRVSSPGTVNALFRLGDTMSVRLPRVESGVQALLNEREWLPLLTPHLPVPVPEPLALGEPGPGFPWPWSVHRWLDGTHPAPGADQPLGLALDLAGFIRAVRGVPYRDGPASYRGGDLADVDAATREAITRLGADLDTARATALWDESVAAPAWDGPPMWAHSDLLPANLLVAGNGRLGGVLDFGTAGLGDPSCDLMPAWAVLPAGERGIFREALGVDDASWLRGRGWALSMALLGLPYYRETNPSFAAMCRRTIDAVLTATSSSCR
ncbi:aminoglycoside phosphotransferase family protein [Actinomadura harenae]|uniref:Aminoglycoside phosphotransferase family protein n=2 Tax=Actinomadura harenae TaxID=2483351 RepID=A0A3M2MD40_9ACTN|nr:aminoglycoside phosphotransferase family protein [Actinomadura harenae]